MTLILSISISRSAYRIRCKLVENWPRKCPFMYFPRWRTPPSWISEKCYFGILVTLALTTSIALQIWCKLTKNCMPRYAPLCIFQEVAILDILFLHFGPLTMSQLLGSVLPASGVMISLNLSEILRFYHFAILCGKCLFPPILEILGI